MGENGDSGQENSNSNPEPVESFPAVNMRKKPGYGVVINHGEYPLPFEKVSCFAI